MVGKPHTPEARLYVAFLRSECRLITSEALISEFKRVMGYERIRELGVTPDLVAGMAFNLMLLGEYIEHIPPLNWPSLSDKKDWYLMDLWMVSEADALVTWDKQLLALRESLGVPIVSPCDIAAMLPS